jgi:hypothetical protein
MKVTVLYTKATARGMRLMVGFDEGLPSLKDINQNYAVVYHDETERDYKVTPEDIFRIFNGADSRTQNPLANEEGQAKLKRLEVGHTSMSVGDIVQIDDTIYICQNTGWATMTWKTEW